MSIRSEQSKARDRAESDFGALEQRIYSVEQGILSINNALSSLSVKLDERSQTSWPTLASFATVIVVVMGGLGALAKSPIDASLARIELSLPSFSTRGEVLIATTRIDRDILRLEKKVDDNHAITVPRGEHVEKWRSYDLQHAVLQHELDEFRKELGAAYSFRDAFIDLKRNVDDLQKHPK